MKTIYLSGVLAILLLSNCTKQSDTEITIEERATKSKIKQQENLDQINFTKPNLFPEGVVFDPFNNRFYVSSTTQGDIGIVTADGTYTSFITDDILTSTTGLELDKARKRLYVSNSTNGVGVYSIETGQRIFYADLASLLPGTPIFINDIALDPQGNAYVTNSSSPVIYKITPDGVASIFIQEPALALPSGQFGFNGIEYANQGFLLVAYTSKNQILKILIYEPTAFSIVQLNTTLNRPDGLLLSKDGKQLIVVNNAGGAEGVVKSFSSTDKWKSANEVESFVTGSVFPTTATSDGKYVYVLYTYLNRRTTSGQETFQIQRVPLSDSKGF